ncbi:hypothetical protein A7A08_02159 [Methyloligella halotolerans]|uniref:DUF1254 domain-containing protein n=1 Tax=Methyloligella halotolerans TaxID=1177755 RepID=A0A1E2RXI4_9HYPH|nr:DUF1254 domain-containing protein [Methyloligella halotolerans]ODA66862.1 hypothetical protein A7A08_02159 [Methyloligella halotolerans]
MRLRHFAYFLLLTVVLAGLLHVLGVFALPYLSSQTAWKRLEAAGDANKIIRLESGKSGRQILSMMAPDIRYAVCRFDLSDGPVRLVTPTENGLWVVALYTPDGDNFYAVNAEDLVRPLFNLVIATENQTVIEEGVDAPVEADQVAVVRSPTFEGIAVIRAPLNDQSEASVAEQALANAYCGPYSAQDK